MFYKDFAHLCPICKSNYVPEYSVRRKVPLTNERGRQQYDEHGNKLWTSQSQVQEYCSGDCERKAALKEKMLESRIDPRYKEMFDLEREKEERVMSELAKMRPEKKEDDQSFDPLVIERIKNSSFKYTVHER